jgi:ferredoxin-NADP reductase
MAMLRTLCDEGHRGEVIFVLYARTAADRLYEPEARALAARHPGVSVAFLATREGDGHISAESLRGLAGDVGDTHAAVSGPRALIDAVRDMGLGYRARRRWRCFSVC